MISMKTDFIQILLNEWVIVVYINKLAQGLICPKSGTGGPHHNLIEN
jgi:hypothetical protein